MATSSYSSPINHTLETQNFIFTPKQAHHHHVIQTQKQHHKKQQQQQHTRLFLCSSSSSSSLCNKKPSPIFHSSPTLSTPPPASPLFPGGSHPIMETGDYSRELDVAVRVVQMACSLCQRVQDGIVDKKRDQIKAKDDDSPVTVAGNVRYVPWLHGLKLQSCIHH